MSRRASLLIAALLAAGCAPDYREELERQREAFFRRARADVEEAPHYVRREVLETCAKWRHLDFPCDEERTRRDQLECWMVVGRHALEAARRLGRRQRAMQLDTLMRQNLCMQGRRYRKRESGPDF